MGSYYDEDFDYDRDGTLNFHEETDRQDYEEDFSQTGEYENLVEEEETYDTELDLLGYTIDDLDLIDEDERIEILEDAGLDPDDWED